MVHRRLKEFKVVTDKKPEFETSHAVLLVSGKYILQLRDDIPGISAPGQWALFGGRIVDGETPIDAVKREVFEELVIRPAHFNLLRPIDYYDPFERTVVRTWFFWADVTDVWAEHRLQEGKDVKAFDYENLQGLVIPSVMKELIERFHKEKMI